VLKRFGIIMPIPVQANAAHETTPPLAGIIWFGHAGSMPASSFLRLLSGGNRGRPSYFTWSLILQPGFLIPFIIQSTPNEPGRLDHRTDQRHRRAPSNSRILSQYSFEAGRPVHRFIRRSDEAYRKPPESAKEKETEEAEKPEAETRNGKRPDCSRVLNSPAAITQMFKIGVISDTPQLSRSANTPNFSREWITFFMGGDIGDAVAHSRSRSPLRPLPRSLGQQRTKQDYRFQTDRSA